MKTFKCEYIWLDGHTPEANLKSRTKVITLEEKPSLENLPLWSFEGSSILKDKEGIADCILKPIKVTKNMGSKNEYLVICEVINTFKTINKTSTKLTYEDASDFWLFI